MYGVILLDNFSYVNAKLILSVLCTFPISWIFLNISNSWTLVCIRFTWWFIKIQISGPHPQISDSIGIKWNLKMFISNTSLCDANAPGLGTTLWGWLIYDSPLMLYTSQDILISSRRSLLTAHENYTLKRVLRMAVVDNHIWDVHALPEWGQHGL